MKIFIETLNKQETSDKFMKIVKVLFFIFTSTLLYAGEFDLRPIVLDRSYEHDKWNTEPKDQLFEFAAYTVSFDGIDDNNGDDTGDLWGIPEWVSFEIKRTTTDYNLADRPGWKSDRDLYEAGITPKDNTYAVSGTRDLSEVKTDYRFVRGHMCPKDTAERISEDAAYNTHTVLNAVPQLQWQNNGIWKELESLCNDWADKYGRVWVITGPVFFDKNPALWLGQGDEKKAAVPDALFKIVIKENTFTMDTLSFLIPNILPKTEKDPADYLTNFKRIESLTGLDFFTYTDENQIIQTLEREISW
ncbi:MAG: DNA/RNA non-specific endonuclease [Spirochaetaceae bacterium]|jgi:DNA/RNA endonuclease G (NUC1)|nr:DNA/RNA non-specific endonuclease [Spirochaetaceae bacterium]